MAEETTPIRVVLDSLKKGVIVSKEQIKYSLKEFEDRLKSLGDEHKEKFNYCILLKMLQNLGNDQMKSVKVQLSKAEKWYEDLLKLPHYKEEMEPTGYLAIRGSQSKQPKHKEKTTQQTPLEGRRNDRKEQRMKDDQPDENRIKMNDMGKMASFNMKNNPLIAELSDTNRPTKIAERFSELYDNEWTEAFEELMKLLKTDEKVIKILLEVVTDSYTFCKQLADQQIRLIKYIMKTGKPQSKYDERALEDVKEDDRMPLVQYRKLNAHLTIDTVKKDFSKRVNQYLHIHRLPVKSDKGAFHIYVQKCAEITWWMCVQDPPIAMSDPRDTQKSTSRKFDQNEFGAYTKLGSTIKYLVWPCLRLHEGGPILCKGVAEGV